MTQEREVALAALAGKTEDLLFIGGPAHGLVHTVERGGMWYQVPVFGAYPHSTELYERRYVGGGRYDGRGRYVMAHCSSVMDVEAEVAAFLFLRWLEGG